MHSCATGHRHHTALQQCVKLAGHLSDHVWPYYAIPADVKASLAAQCMQGFLARVRLVSDMISPLMIGSVAPLRFGALPAM